MATDDRGFASMSEEDRKDFASKGGHASTGKFGGPNSADPSAAGKLGNKREPRAAKVEGGKHSHRTDADRKAA